jgi:diacylglycerol O-acyltransferase / wax synthase
VTRPQALSPLESAFLAIERARTPMHIGTVGIFEGGALRDSVGRIRIDEIRDRLERRLDPAPKLRCRVQSAVLPGAPPVWVDDSAFDIARHVELESPTGPVTERRLWDRCARLFSERLDRDRPLWHLCIIDGLSDGRVAVVERLHHAMADGLAGVEMASVLFDSEPESDRLPPPGPTGGGTRRQAPAPPGVGAGMVQDLGRLGDLGCRWGNRGVRSLQHPAATVRDLARLGGAVATMAGTGLLRPSSSLNRPIGSGRRVEVARLPLDRLRRSAHAQGVTVNDLVLTAVGGGVGRLLRGRGERPGDIQVLVPVGLEPGDRHELGNKVSAWMVRVPVVDADPLDRLRSVTDATGRARHRREEMAVEVALDLLAPAPRPVLTALGSLANHQPMFNLVVTNVPGPPVPLYFSGARLLEAYPFVPLAGNLTLGIAVMSYEGLLTLGVLADPLTCPDAEVMLSGIEEDLDRLMVPGPEAAGDEPVGPRRPPTRPHPGEGR